jgi:hypothetical protein
MAFGIKPVEPAEKCKYSTVVAALLFSSKAVSFMGNKISMGAMGCLDENFDQQFSISQFKL